MVKHFYFQVETWRLSWQSDDFLPQAPELQNPFNQTTLFTIIKLLLFSNISF